MATAGGLTSRQIGEALGEPPGTVRYRLSQARKQLATALNLEDEP
jgi:RNA polymerase sigma-70 factor, ECF subfamily